MFDFPFLILKFEQPLRFRLLRKPAMRMEGMLRGLALKVSIRWSSCFLVLALFAGGCGTTKSYTATEQLLMSDAVDSTISKIDFRPLTGKSVFLDTTYIQGAGKIVPGVQMPVNLVTADYVISGIRQQMLAAGCNLVEKREDAEIVCEARCGALGTDGHSVIYGIPASNGLSGVGNIVTGTPSIPAIPEISLAKRELKSAAGKVACFAYTRETHEPVWQSGIAQAGSNARDTWFLGIGPWQYGTIYRGTRFAGKRIKGTEKIEVNDKIVASEINGVNHREGFIFVDPTSDASPGTNNLAAQPSASAPGDPPSLPNQNQIPSNASIPNSSLITR
jgi:hypothetical protein